MLNFYFDEDIFEQIFKNKELANHKELIRLIQSNKFSIGIPEKKINTLEVSEDEYIRFILRELKNANKINKYELKINESLIQRNIENFPFAICFFKNIDESIMKKMRSENGIAYFKYPEELNEFYKKLFVSFRVKLNDGKYNIKSWGESILKITPTFSNSIIISDPYLFSNEKNYKNNLKNLIYKLLQSVYNLTNDFQISIFVRHPKTIKNNRTEEENLKVLNLWKEDIEEFKKQIMKDKKLKNLKIQINFTQVIHKRIILSNYFYLWTDKGFANIGNNEKNDLHFQSQLHNYHSPCESYFDFVLSDLIEIHYLKEKASNTDVIGDQFENRLFNVLKTNNTN